jgi:NhaP-type Na+/H+ and K+/H+ antiporter
VAVVLRDGTVIAPKGPTRLTPGDHVFIVSQTSQREAVDRVFDTT